MELNQGRYGEITTSEPEGKPREKSIIEKVKVQPFYATILRNELLNLKSIVKYFEENKQNYSIREVANLAIMYIEDKWYIETRRLEGNSYPYGTGINTFATFCRGNSDSSHKRFITLMQKLRNFTEGTDQAVWVDVILSITSKEKFTARFARTKVFESNEVDDYLTSCYNGEVGVMKTDISPVSTPAFSVTYIVLRYFFDICRDFSKYDTWEAYLKADTEVDMYMNEAVYNLSKEIQSEVNMLTRGIIMKHEETDDLPEEV